MLNIFKTKGIHVIKWESYMLVNSSFNMFDLLRFKSFHLSKFSSVNYLFYLQDIATIIFQRGDDKIDNCCYIKNKVG